MFPFPKKLPLLCLFSLLPVLLLAQKADTVFEKLTGRLERHTVQTNSPDLFLHLDKSVYVNNENIWFTAYLLGSTAAWDDYYTLHVLLVQRARQAVVASQRLVIEKGIAKGYLFIADSFPTGEYELVAYPNSLLSNTSQPLFRQFISIRSQEKTPFDLTVKYDTTIRHAKDSLPMICRITTDYGGFATGGDFIYDLFSNGKKIQSGKTKVNAFGEVPVMIANKQATAKMELLAKVARDTKKQFFTMPVVPAPQQLTMKFYPEGGNLVAAQSCRVAFEIRKPDGAGAAVKGFIMENGDTVTTFESNLYGIGTFYMMPRAGVHYTVLLNPSPAIALQYSFPAVVENGYTLQVPVAIVEDSVRMNIYTTERGSHCYIMLHNYREMFYTVNVLVNNKGCLVLPVNQCPDGIATLTLFDAQGRPQAERSILVQHGKQPLVTVQVDSAKYHRRSMVKIKINVRDEAGKGIPAVFSFAAVFDKRIDSTRFQDIVRFWNFDRSLPERVSLPPLGYFNNATDVEMLLLTRFWTRYKWHELEQPPATTASYHPELYGYVRYHNKPLRQPVEILALGTNIQSFTTDSSGNFDIPFGIIRAPADNNVLLSMAEKKKQNEDYSIVFKNDYERINDSLAALYQPLPSVFQKDTLTVQERDMLKKLGPAKTLQTVVVTNKKTGDDYVARPKWKDPCDDYVCMFNILNCPNHPFSGMKPVEGAIYTYRGKTIVYRDECKGKTVPQYMQKVKATFYTKEFYVADYAKLNPTDPETNTTLLWQHEIMTDKNGDATLQFYTNDLSGKISCILQGITASNVISGRTSFQITAEQVIR